MKPSRLALSMFVLFALVGLGLGFVGPEVPFSSQWPLYEALRTTAAIIFAVIGAWIAIAFPERLRMLDGADNQRVEITSRRFQDLFTPVVNSTVILCLVLIVGLLAPIIKGSVENLATIGLLRRSSFSLLAVLTLWQVWTVVLTLFPADALESKMEADIALNRSRKAMRGLGQEVAPLPDDDA